MPDHEVGRTIEEIWVGQTAIFTKTITDADIEDFARLTGDNNPLHTDPGFARLTRFGEPIAQGMLVASFISATIGTKLPGPGTIYVFQDLKFLRPVKIGDVVTAKVEVEEVIKDKNRVRLKTTCLNQRGEEVITGMALVIPPTVSVERKVIAAKAEEPKPANPLVELALAWMHYIESVSKVPLLIGATIFQKRVETVSKGVQPLHALFPLLQESVGKHRTWKEPL